jgi:multidrug resistance protein
VVFTTILIDFAGFSVLIPVLPLFADRLGADAFEVALIVTVYALAQLLFLPAWGWFSDRFGRRPVILLSLLGTTGAYLMLALAETLEVIYLSRVLAGFFAASVGTAQAVVTDVTDRSERAHGMGQIGAAMGLAFVIGPALGGPLSSIQERLPFYTVAAIAGLNFVLAWMLLPETRPAIEAAPAWRDLWRSLVPTPLRLILTVHDRRIGLFLYLFFHVFTAFAALEGVFPIFLGRQFQASELEVGLVFAWIGVFVVLSQGFLVGRLNRHFSESTVVAAGLFACGAGLSAIAWAPSFGWFYPLGALVAVGSGIAFPTLISLYSQACEAREAGELLGQGQSMITAGRVVGPVWAGWVMVHVAPGASFAVAGLLLVAALAVLLVFRSTLLKRSG